MSKADKEEGKERVYERNYMGERDYIRGRANIVGFYMKISKYVENIQNVCVKKETG